MSKQAKKSGAPSRKGRLVWGIAIAAVLVITAVIVLAAALRGEEAQEDTAGLMTELAGWQGSSRTVEQKEYDFFCGVVARNFPAAGSEEEQEQLVRDYIAKVNAKFALGNHLGLCEPFDFATMEFRMEQENTIRSAKAANGDTVYGATRFELPSYFSYLDTTLETEIVNYLVEHADQPMLDQARAYYDAHQDSFEQMVSITYEIEEDGQTTTETLSSSGMRTLEKGDGLLADFLYTAQPGDTMDYPSPEGDAARRVTLVDAVYEIPAFDNAVAAAVSAWLNVEVMDGLYVSIAEKAPVTFALDP